MGLLVWIASVVTVASTMIGGIEIEACSHSLTVLPEQGPWNEQVNLPMDCWLTGEAYATCFCAQQDWSNVKQYTVISRCMHARISRCKSDNA
eukprot:g59363.t1